MGKMWTGSYRWKFSKLGLNNKLRNRGKKLKSTYCTLAMSGQGKLRPSKTVKRQGKVAELSSKNETQIFY
jgi:hypothetical protein